MTDTYAFYESFSLICEFDIKPTADKELSIKEYMEMRRAALVEVRIQLLVSTAWDPKSVANDSRVLGFINRFAYDGIIKTTLPDNRFKLGELSICDWQPSTKEPVIIGLVSNAIESKLNDGSLAKELKVNGKEPLLVLPFMAFHVPAKIPTKKRKTTAHYVLSESESEDNHDILKNLYV